MCFPRLTRLFVIFLLLAPLHAQAQTEDRAGADAAGKAADTEKADRPASRPPKQKTDTTTFTPSEKIRADEAVSFPVDI